MTIKWLGLLAVFVVSAGCGHSQPSQTAANETDASALAGSFALPSGPIGPVGAARLLTQGTFGPTLDGINSTSTESYADWFGTQVGTPPTLLLPQVSSTSGYLVPWWSTAVTAQDQLRQRVSFALSEILVVSEQSGALNAKDTEVANYSDLLTKDALGNFRTLLNDITLSPAMGVYLTYFKNQAPNPAAGIHADENYAREVMQLFTIGLEMLNPDGSLQLDSSGNPIPTYALPEVENLARVFTGWASQPIAPDTTTDQNAWNYDYDLMDPMSCYSQYHDTGSKTIVGPNGSYGQAGRQGVVIPAGGTCASDMKIALDTLFNHPNVGPYFGRQLIERLVTSNPSPQYVGRVTAAFNNNGAGVRGDMLAVVEAILTDPEARTAGTAAKLREMILRFTELYRAFAVPSPVAAGLIVVQGYPTYDQAPYFSPTVFNFFRPNYSEPGPLASANLVAPEFQITNELTEVNFSSILENQVYAYVDSAGEKFSGPDNYAIALGTGDVLLQTAAFEPLASNVGTLLDQLGLVFMEGAMPDTMKSTIMTYLNAAPLGSYAAPQGQGQGGNAVNPPVSNMAAASAALTVINATDLIVNSAQYAIQR
jgi:uncharacterized protein (DUF1800 family)